jgi:hypothetical protein
MSFRKERKYQLSFSDQKLLKKNLLSKGMKELYPSRKINSCYFDNVILTMFHDSEEGVLPRKKIRVRWYDQENKSKLETKISSIEGRFKTSKIFDKFDLIRQNYNIYLIDKVYGKIKPSLIVSYDREYYVLNSLRLTFDYNIEYTDLRLLLQKKYNDNNCVTEVKTNIDIPDDFIEKIIEHPTSRFSKYSRGLLIADKQI